jgi:hypothetical protein
VISIVGKILVSLLLVYSVALTTLGVRMFPQLRPALTPTSVGSAYVAAVYTDNGAAICKALGDRTTACVNDWNQTLLPAFQLPPAQRNHFVHQATVRVDGTTFIDAYDVYNVHDVLVLTLVLLVQDGVIVQVF